VKYEGGCHCGAVKFEVEADEHLACVKCNCSICAMTGFLHLIVPRSKFTLLSDKANLTVYRFNTGVAKHSFCSTCGIKSFYTPRSNPEGVDVNIRCLTPTPLSLNVSAFDGQRWEDNAHSLAHLSQE